jgi:signal transduction histidine kinase
LAPGQVVGKRVEEVLPESAHALMLGKYRQAIRENKTVRWEQVSAYPTGTLAGEVAVTPARDADGNCTHLIGSVHDITEIRRAEEQVRQLNAELEERVVERTAQLQTANKDLEAFSYSVSHDLRAPLRAISGFAEILARRHRADLNEEGRHYLDNIVQASERMGRLIDDLLTFSRLGRQAVRREPVPLRDVLDPLRRDLSAQLTDIHGTLEIADDLPTVMGDKTLLSQTFANLLGNAIIYRRKEVPVRITVTWQSQDRDAIIRVSDNGIGIPSEYYEKIFNIFQRLHTEEEYPGTGIGLAIVKKSVELLGGHVWVESVEQQGSTFFVRLPRIS